MQENVQREKNNKLGDTKTMFVHNHKHCNPSGKLNEGKRRRQKGRAKREDKRGWEMEHDNQPSPR